MASELRLEPHSVMESSDEGGRESPLSWVSASAVSLKLFLCCIGPSSACFWKLIFLNFTSIPPSGSSGHLVTKKVPSALAKLPVPPDTH